MKRPLTTGDLNRTACAHPGCDHTQDEVLILHARCHPEFAPWATYHRETGTLSFACSICGVPVTVVAVAGEWQ